MDKPRGPMEWLIRRFWVPLMLLSRGMTLGVRVIATNSEGAVLLVRHGYTPGWHLPGGGVDHGETCEQAAYRELEEETGWRAVGPLEMRGFCFHRNQWKGDHVAVYEAKTVEQVREVEPRFEIQEIGFFPLNGLPEGTTKATKTRLAEWQSGSPVDAYWS